MAGRRLSPEERDIWDKVTRSVAPLHPLPRIDKALRMPADQQLSSSVKPADAERSVRAASPLARPVSSPRKASVPVLDDSWERRIATGALIPEMSVDLHGHSLDAAHRRLNQTLAAAVARGVRVLLIITGNPRPSSVDPGHKGRGAIRAEIGDWLALSGHAEAIASVRAAHPRHGGRGALYVILRRKK